MTEFTVGVVSYEKKGCCIGAIDLKFITLFITYILITYISYLLHYILMLHYLNQKMHFKSFFTLNFCRYQLKRI